jgi:hypothetical protein
VVGLPLPWQSATDTDLLYRLYDATDRVIADIMNLMRGAGRLARKQGVNRLELDVLAAIFDIQLAKHLGKSIDLFRACLIGDTICPASILAPAQDTSSGKKNQVKKKKQSSTFRPHD